MSTGDKSQNIQWEPFSLSISVENFQAKITLQEINSARVEHYLLPCCKNTSATRLWPHFPMLFRYPEQIVVLKRST